VEVLSPAIMSFVVPRLIVGCFVSGPVSFGGVQVVIERPSKTHAHEYTFDAVFDSTADSGPIFKTLSQPRIESKSYNQDEVCWCELALVGTGWYALCTWCFLAKLAAMWP
jgi:hypothetical protein